MRNALALAFLALLPAFAGCAGTSTSPDVMATFYPLELFAQRIAGPEYAVESVVKSGVEPHDYEPTPQDIARIAGAKALVIQGAGFESWLVTAQSQAPDTRLILATEGITFLAADAGDPHGHGEEPESEPGHEEEPAGHEEGEWDPHTWLDPVLAQQMVRNIQRGLVAAFPESQATFAANADTLVADLAALDAEFRAGLQVCELRLIITGHAAFGYLAARYNFEQLAISGLDPHDEPDPQTVQLMIEEAQEHGVKVIFFEDLVSPQVAQTIASEVGAKTLLLTPLEGIPPQEQAEGKDYFSQMRMNLQNLREGMVCA